ncbi:hypothetical protein FGO68_gene7637 [Halteria grandinella]|uniref:Origin recognition complex subunit 4 C-terminal domain-containing protein n=1 Tax=Halteria grandinella TaxID=5974 RepID=A0A8J8NTC4_HALGN|nr:hypothetical protein FGO68_gene7637 [Halteria grandinella]
MIVSLTNLTKTNSSDFYKDQCQQVMSLLKQAYLKGENNSMLLLARSKQTMHSFINAISDDIRAELDQSKVELKVIRVNSILLNSETKILLKLGESLRLKQHQQAMAAKAQFHQLEMVDSIKRYFEENPGMAVLFVLEDIDYYVETTKQLLLYKILDMFSYLASDRAQVRFVFLATSVKHDIVDSFEKRIKSRFSHRMVLFYEQKLETFTDNLQVIFNRLLEGVQSEGQRTRVNALQSIVMGDATVNALQDEFDQGKNYEYLCQMIRIALSGMDRAIQKKKDAPPHEQIQQNKVLEFLGASYKNALQDFSNLKQLAEPVKVLENLPKYSLIVLIAAAKCVNDRVKVFNFETVFQKYAAFMKTHQSVNIKIDKHTFLKLFVDLINQGLLRSDSGAPGEQGASTDILNVNNKIGLGFRERDLAVMLEEAKSRHNLPHLIMGWATYQ